MGEVRNVYGSCAKEYFKMQGSFFPGGRKWKQSAVWERRRCNQADGLQHLALSMKVMEKVFKSRGVTGD